MPGKLPSVVVGVLNYAIESSARTRLRSFPVLAWSSAIPGTCRGSFRCCPSRNEPSENAAFQEIRQRRELVKMAARLNGPATVQMFFSRWQFTGVVVETYLQIVVWSRSPAPFGRRREACVSLLLAFPTAIPKMERGVWGMGGWVGRVRGWNIGPRCEKRLRAASLCAVDESRRERRKAWVRERGDRVHFHFWQRATDLLVGVCSAASACV